MKPIRKFTKEEEERRYLFRGHFHNFTKTQKMTGLLQMVKAGPVKGAWKLELELYEEANDRA